MNLETATTPDIAVLVEAVVRNSSNRDVILIDLSIAEDNVIIWPTKNKDKLFESDILLLNDPLPSDLVRQQTPEPTKQSVSYQFQCPFPLAHPELLWVPKARSQHSSLPGTIDPDELYRLRNLSIKGKKVINRGDS